MNTFRLSKKALLTAFIVGGAWGLLIGTIAFIYNINDEVFHLYFGGSMFFVVPLIVIICVRMEKSDNQNNDKNH